MNSETGFAAPFFGGILHFLGANLHSNNFLVLPEGFRLHLFFSPLGLRLIQFFCYSQISRFLAFIRSLQPSATLSLFIIIAISPAFPSPFIGCSL